MVNEIPEVFLADISSTLVQTRDHRLKGDIHNPHRSLKTWSVRPALDALYLSRILLIASRPCDIYAIISLNLKP